MRPTANGGGDRGSVVECGVGEGGADQMARRLGQGSSGNKVVNRVSQRFTEVRCTGQKRLQLTVEVHYTSTAPQ